jgi:hypothetical protein
MTGRPSSGNRGYRRAGPEARAFRLPTPSLGCRPFNDGDQPRLAPRNHDGARSMSAARENQPSRYPRIWLCCPRVADALD